MQVDDDKVPSADSTDYFDCRNQPGLGSRYSAVHTLVVTVVLRFYIDRFKHSTDLSRQMKAAAALRPEIIFDLGDGLELSVGAEEQSRSIVRFLENGATFIPFHHSSTPVVPK